MDAFTSATQWAAAIARREVSPVEVADLYLDRIDKLDPQLNAFTFRDDDRVRPGLDPRVVRPRCIKTLQHS